MELETAKTRLEDTAKEKDDLHSKVINLENKLINMQQDMSKKVFVVDFSFRK